MSLDGGAREKHLTLAVARRLAIDLARVMPHAEVVLTRDRDSTLGLAERVATANALGADLFVSLHANASPNHDQEGFETYILDDGASSWDAALTARRENDRARGRPGVRGGAEAMVRELALLENRTKAAYLANAIQVQQAVRFPDRLDRGVKQAPFDVLMGARMPAVLFEVGFLDHPKEGSQLLDGDGQGRAVEGLTRAITDYYREVVRPG